MKNHPKSHNPVLRVLGQILDFIQDKIINELPTVVSSRKKLELLEAEKKRAQLANQLHTEFLTFLAVCVFMVVLIVLSYKAPKRNDDEEEEEADEVESQGVMSTNSMLNVSMNESREGSVYSVPMHPDDFKDGFLRCDCGDSTSMSQLGELSSINLEQDDHNFANFTEPSSPSQVSVQTAPDYLPQAEDLQQHPTQEQTPKKLSEHRRARLERQNNYDSNVRRTRSGLVYGRYPTP